MVLCNLIQIKTYHVEFFLSLPCAQQTKEERSLLNTGA